MTETQVFKYEDIPGFPLSTVQGHAGELVFGLLSGVATVCLRGRFHSYEGYSMDLCALPVRVMRCLGVKMVVVTNAAGGLNPNYNVGDILCISDHFAIPNLAGKNCLVGHNDDELGPRFPPMSNAYDPKLLEFVGDSAKALGFSDFVRSGPDNTYCFVSGPMYETRAESKWLRSIGGSSVGMSTVPEVVAAHHCGMAVVCLSLITNKVVMPGDTVTEAASHAEVLEAVGKRSVQIQALVKDIVVRSRSYIESRPKLEAVNLETRQKKGKDGKVCLNSVVVGVAAGAILMALASRLVHRK
jgi:purine-nucleoside phosphorylase